MGISKSRDDITPWLARLNKETPKLGEMALTKILKDAQRSAQKDFFRPGRPGKRAEYISAPGMKRGHFARHAVPPKPAPVGGILTSRNRSLKNAIRFAIVSVNADKVLGKIFVGLGFAVGRTPPSAYAYYLLKRNAMWNPTLRGLNKILALNKDFVKKTFDPLLLNKAK